MDNWKLLVKLIRLLEDKIYTLNCKLNLFDSRYQLNNVKDFLQMSIQCREMHYTIKNISYKIKDNKFYLSITISVIIKYCCLNSVVLT